MNMPRPETVSRVACIGAGTIGAGWASLFLSRGMAVVACDPADSAEDRLRAQIARAWPSLEALGLAAGADPSWLRFETDLEAALDGAEFVQESAPDRQELKVELIERVDRCLPDNVVIASSSSTFLPSVLAGRCRAPARVIVGHPFTPSYLMPLVEVVGGDATADSVLDWAMAFYRRVGKRPLRLRREIERYISNRLQVVVRREIDSLVASGICDYREADEALLYGPGMRWAFMGPTLGMHFTGGQGGIRGTIAHFGWSGPAGLEDAAVAAVDEMTRGHDVDALERWRDRNLVALLKALKPLEPGG